MKRLAFWLALTAIAFAAFSFENRPAMAQAVQPVYTRPAKGDAVVVIPTTALGGATVSSMYDFSRFMGAVVTVTVTGGDCLAFPRVYVTEAQTTAGPFLDIFSRNGQAIVRQSTGAISYFVAIQAKYAKFNLASQANQMGGANVCSASVMMTAIPTEPSPIVALSSDWNGGVYTVALVSTVIVTPDNHTSHTLQNHGTTPLFCSLAEAITGFSGVGSYGVILKGSTVALDGTGGSWTIPDYNGYISCIRGTGSGDVSVYSY